LLKWGFWKAHFPVGWRNLRGAHRRLPKLLGWEWQSIL